MSALPQSPFGPPLAFNFEQLAQTRAGNELERLTREGFLAAHPGRGTLPSLVDPFDRGASLEIRARSYSMPIALRATGQVPAAQWRPISTSIALFLIPDWWLFNRHEARLALMMGE